MPELITLIILQAASDENYSTGLMLCEFEWKYAYAFVWSHLNRAYPKHPSKPRAITACTKKAYMYFNDWQ
jgi:hypothetical protein